MKLEELKNIIDIDKKLFLIRQEETQGLFDMVEIKFKSIINKKNIENDKLVEFYIMFNGSTQSKYQPFTVSLSINELNENIYTNLIDAASALRYLIEDNVDYKDNSNNELVCKTLLYEINRNYGAVFRNLFFTDKTEELNLSLDTINKDKFYYYIEERVDLDFIYKIKLSKKPTNTKNNLITFDRQFTFNGDIKENSTLLYPEDILNNTFSNIDIAVTTLRKRIEKSLGYEPKNKYTTNMIQSEVNTRLGFTLNTFFNYKKI